MTDLPRFETLLLERRGRALHVTLNRPETKNAINRDMVRDLTALADLMEQDRETSAIVMRGANGTFCAGGDIKGFMAMFKSAPPKAGEKDSVALGNREFGSFMTRFEALPQAIVMVVEGAAYGGGLGLLCAGDVVLATADAKFAMSETGLGIPPAQIAPFVAARVGIARTRRLALTGYRFDGREAERIGLVDVACADAGRARGRASRRCSPRSAAARRARTRAIKRLLLASRTMPRDQLLDESADAFAACLRGPEGQEGVTAFLEKRKPNWVDDADLSRSFPRKRESSSCTGSRFRGDEWRTNEERHEPCGPSGGRDLERHRAGRAHRILRVAQSRAHAGAGRHSGLPPRAALHREIRHAGIFHALRGRLARKCWSGRTISTG